MILSCLILIWLLNDPGDAHVQTSQSLEAVFVNSGNNPFELIRNSIKYVLFLECPYSLCDAMLYKFRHITFTLYFCWFRILEKHKGTFSHLEHKKIPAHLDWFGWCTWDAFYTEVSPQGIREGLQRYNVTQVTSQMWWPTNVENVNDSFSIYLTVSQMEVVHQSFSSLMMDGKRHSMSFTKKGSHQLKEPSKSLFSIEAIEPLFFPPILTHQHADVFC